MERKIAVIDLGTNTFNLLLAEMGRKDYKIFYSDKIPVKIGQGGINKNIITASAKRRALEAINIFQNKIVEEGIKDIYAFATSAFRNASNGTELKEEIRRKTGIDINIINGDLEAYYIYQGVKGALEIGDEPNLIMDIGGGSVEMIIGNSEQIFWQRSYEIGAQRLLDQFHDIDPIPPEETILLNAYFDDHLSSLAAAMNDYNIDTLIGSSGSFDTLSEIHCAANNISFDPLLPEFPLDLESYYSIHEDIISKTKVERLKIPGMIEMRVDMIVVASCLIKYVVNKFNIKYIRVSSHSLKEGLLDKIQADLYTSKKIFVID